jgi:hypothetical protein
MRGLAIGEVSSSSNPVLQLFARNGEYLTDIYSGSYVIQDITDPGANPVARVAATPIDTTNDKLGTGRYVLASGATTSWVEGTHRAIVTYQMTDGGPTHTQVIEFEVLNANDWAVGSLFLGYASSARLIGDGYVEAGTAARELHRHIDRVSRQVERWTHRSFEPQYRAIRHDGAPSPILHLSEAIIALEMVQAIWKDSSGAEQTYDYDPYLFQVYNRHLDGTLAPDDRHNPRIVRKDNWIWPEGYGTVKVLGIFGWTDPLADFEDSRANIGKLPDDLVQVIGTLVSRYLDDPTYSDLSVHQPGKVKMMKTRDQSVSFGSTGSLIGTASTDSMTGDPMLDQVLVRFAPPISLRYADKRRQLEEEEEDATTGNSYGV